MHSLLVVGIEAVAVDSPAQDAPAALKHKAAARAGEISHSKPTCPLISFISNSTHDHHSDSISNNNTTISADNNCIVNGLIAALGARMITGPMQSGGTNRNPRLPPTRPWGLSLSVGGVVI